MSRNLVPILIRHSLDNIPGFLRASPQWIHWAATEEKNDGRFNKVPVSRTGFNINAHDPINWMTFEEAAQSFNPAVHSGIAIDLGGSKVKAADTLEEVFLIGVDLDRCVLCVNQDGTPALTPQARGIIDALNSYCVVLHPKLTHLAG